MSGYGPFGSEVREILAEMKLIGRTSWPGCWLLLFSRQSQAVSGCSGFVKKSGRLFGWAAGSFVYQNVIVSAQFLLLAGDQNSRLAVAQKKDKMKKRASHPTGRTLDTILLTLLLVGVIGLAALFVFVYGGFIT